MSDLHATAVDWVLRSLHAERVDCDETLAEALVGVAEDYDVPVELLVKWIHDRCAGKEHALDEWARWCAKYRETADRLATQYALETARMEKPVQPGEEDAR